MLSHAEEQGSKKNGCAQIEENADIDFSVNDHSRAFDDRQKKVRADLLAFEISMELIDEGLPH